MKAAFNIQAHFERAHLDGRTRRWLNNLKERFWNKVKLSLPDQCWPWQGTLATRGYGSISIGRHRCHAQRVAFFLHNGHLSVDKFVMHKCDNPPCCNPAHLIEGTEEENRQDMYNKRRHTIAEQHPMSKVTWPQVKAIRARYAQGDISQEKLGLLNGLSQAQTRRIINNECWTE